MLVALKDMLCSKQCHQKFSSLHGPHRIYYNASTSPQGKSFGHLIADSGFHHSLNDVLNSWKHSLKFVHFKHLKFNFSFLDWSNVIETKYYIAHVHVHVCKVAVHVTSGRERERKKLNPRENLGPNFFPWFNFFLFFRNDTYILYVQHLPMFSIFNILVIQCMSHKTHYKQEICFVHNSVRVGQCLLRCTVLL